MNNKNEVETLLRAARMALDAAVYENERGMTFTCVDSIALAIGKLKLAHEKAGKMRVEAGVVYAKGVQVAKVVAPETAEDAESAEGPRSLEPDCPHCLDTGLFRTWNMDGTVNKVMVCSCAKGDAETAEGAESAEGGAK